MWTVLSAFAADELRMAIKEVLCDNDKERHQYEEALIAITVEEPLKRLEYDLLLDEKVYLFIIFFFCDRPRDWSVIC